MDLPAELNPLVVKINVLFHVLRTLDMGTILQIVFEWMKVDNKKLKGGIQVALHKSLLIWDPHNIPSPDFIATILSNVNRQIRMQVHWSESSNGLSVFHGCVVTLESEEMLRRVSREVFMHSRSLVTLPMDRFIDFFIQAEAPPSERRNQRTTIIVRGSKISSYAAAQDEITQILQCFGLVCGSFVYGVTGKANVICTVSYAHVYQAYAAKYYLDDLSNFKTCRKISVVVQETERERASLKKVKRRMREFVDENRFATTVPRPTGRQEKPIL